VREKYGLGGQASSPKSDGVEGMCEEHVLNTGQLMGKYLHRSNLSSLALKRLQCRSHSSLTLTLQFTT